MQCAHGMRSRRTDGEIRREAPAFTVLHRFHRFSANRWQVESSTSSAMHWEPRKTENKYQMAGCTDHDDQQQAINTCGRNERKWRDDTIEKAKVTREWARGENGDTHDKQQQQRRELSPFATYSPSATLIIDCFVIAFIFCFGNAWVCCLILLHCWRMFVAQKRISNSGPFTQHENKHNAPNK